HRGRAGAGADAAQSELNAGSRGSGITEIAIGRKTAPVLVAAIEQVKQDRGGDDRHACRPHGKATALLLEPGLCARGCVETEGRAAGERNRVDALNRLCRVEQGRFTGAGTAATHVDRGDRGFVEYHYGRSRGQLG